MKRTFAAIIAVILIFGILIVPGVQAQDEITAQVLNTPFSVDATSGGFQIPRGSIIIHSGNGEVAVTGPNGKVVFKTNYELSEMVSTPNGLQKASHVYNVPSGSSIQVDNNKIKIYFKDELILQIIDNQVSNKLSRTWNPNDPYIERATAYMGYVDFFWGLWYVPSNPPAPGSSTVDYLFNALTSTNIILQPVLQWNQVGAPGCWTCAAWWGIDFGPGSYQHYVQGTKISASTGNPIRGALVWMTDHWYISVMNNATGQYSYLNSYEISFNFNMSANCALEGKQVDGNEDVPGDTTFSDLSIRYGGIQKTPSWSAIYNAPPGVTDLLVQIISSSCVKLHTAN